MCISLSFSSASDILTINQNSETEENKMQNKDKEENFKFPKRRKSKDNDYTIGYDEQEKSYFLTFPNESGIIQQIYIEQAMYEAFNEFELDDLSQINEQQRHMAAAELTEEYLHKNLSQFPNVVEEEVERKIMNDFLLKAIESLIPTQRRRLILYYFEDVTYEQIAQIEGCSARAIKYSVDCAKNNLKKSLKKFWI
jgi:RNA polymerase sigma factor (sigma-70 family)